MAIGLLTLAKDDIGQAINDAKKDANTGQAREIPGQGKLFTPNGEATHDVDAAGVVTTDADKAEKPKKRKSFSEEYPLPEAGQEDLLECDTCGTVAVANSSRQNGGERDVLRHEGDVCGVPSENPSEPACHGKLRAHAVV